MECDFATNACIQRIDGPYRYTKIVGFASRSGNGYIPVGKLVPDMSEKRMVTKDFVLDTSISFFGSLTFFILTASIASYATWRYGSSSAEAGLAAGLFVIGGLVSRVSFGRYIELLGRKRVLVTALVLSCTASATYYFTETFTLLCVTRFLHGMAYGICSAATSDIITKMTPVDRRGEGLGYFLLSVTLSTAIGPMLALAFLDADAYESIFLLCVVSNISSLIIAAFLHVEEEELTEEQKADLKVLGLKGVFHLPALPLSLITMTLMLSYSGVLSFLASYTDAIGLSEAGTFFYLIYAMVTLITRFTIGKVFDRKGPNSVMVPAFVFFIAGMAVYSAAENTVMFLIPAVLFGLAVSTIYPSGQTMVVNDVGPDKYGSAVSTYQSMTDLGSGLGPMLIGTIIGLTGYREAYVVCAVIAAVSFTLYWIVCGRCQKRNGSGTQ